MKIASDGAARPPSTRALRNWRAFLRIGLGGAVSLALVAWAVWSLDWQQVWRALRIGTARSGWIVLALVTVLLTIAARALRWRGLLLPQRFGGTTLLTALLAGQVVNYIVLTRLGDVVRAAALGQGHRARALGTVALEKLWDVGMLLGLTAALSIGQTLPDWLILPTRLLTVGSVSVLLLLLVILFSRNRLPSAIFHWSLVIGRWSLNIGRWLSALLDGLEGIVRPQALLWGLLGSLVVWGLGAATNCCILRAFDLPASLAPVLLLLAGLQAGVAVPSLPGSVGVFEGICIAVLALFEVGREEALAAGLMLHAVVFVPPLLLGGAALWRAGYRLSDQTAHRETLQSPLSDPQSPTSFSIVIPVYNGAETLPGCLQALRTQTFPADRYEIIVVDDGSTDDTAEVARSFGVRVISQPNAGPAAARNRGAKAAQGDVLLFTDADCVPAPDWVARMAAAFAEPDVSGAKGVYGTRERDLVARFVQAEYEDRYDRMRELATIDFVDTYSAAYRRDVFLASGGFDTSFPTASVEDQELSFRLAEAGHRLVFVPDAQVFHIHDRTLGEYARRKFWIGYWKVRVMREHPDKLVRDSHTPQVLKLQIGLAALGALLLVGGGLSRWPPLAGLAAFSLLLASGLPFLVKLLRRRSWAVALVALPLLFLRAWALGLGFLAGLLRLSAGRLRRRKTNDDGNDDGSMTDEQSNEQGPVRSEADKRAWMKWGSLALALLGVILLAVWGVRLVRTGLSLRTHLAQVQALAAAPGTADPVAACGLVWDLRDDVVTLCREAGGLTWLAPALGWLPGVGGDLRAVPHLLVVADGLTEAGALGCDAIGPALAAFGGTGEFSDGLSLERVVRLLAEEHPRLEQAMAAVERAQDAWAQVDADALSPYVAEKTALLDQGLPLLQAGLKAATVAPHLLGMDGQSTYLVLALNEEELRPSGGFISGVGEVRLEAGQLVTMTFRDGYRVDNYKLPYPDPPEPLRRYMGIGLWVFRDSNWSPDFPTAARQAISLYRPGYFVSVDGVIALDQQAVQGLVEVLGPLTVEGAEGPVTGDTIITYIRHAWAREEEEEIGEWWRQRKSFMGLVAEATWERVQGGQADWVALAQTLLRLLEEKHLLIYLDHPDAAALLAEQGWDGGLRSGPGDFLMVVDANIGYNKANARVQEALSYQVDMRQSPPQAVLTLVYTHTSTGDSPCRHGPQYGSTYEHMMDRCYWYYLRLYVPQGSCLLDATRIPVPGELIFCGEDEAGEVAIRPADEGPWQTLAVMGLLPTSVTQTRLFTWTLPADVVQWEDNEGWYYLRVQKQAGTRGHPLTVRIGLPEESVLLDARPKPTATEEAWVIYRAALNRDLEFRLHFGRRP